MRFDEMSNKEKIKGCIGALIFLMIPCIIFPPLLLLFILPMGMAVGYLFSALFSALLNEVKGE